MPMTRIGLLALATSAEAACILPPATLGLADALALAACRSPALQKAEAQREGKPAELELARAAQQPSASLSSGYNRSELDAPTLMSPSVTETAQYALSGSWALGRRGTAKRPTAPGTP